MASGAVGRTSRTPRCDEPVGLLDLAPTFCSIAGVDVPEWMQGQTLPTAPGSGRERVITEWDSQLLRCGMHLRTIYRDGWICTVYEPTANEGLWGRPDRRRWTSSTTAPKASSTTSTTTRYQWRNLWDDPARQASASDLVASLYDKLPSQREPRLFPEAPT